MGIQASPDERFTLPRKGCRYMTIQTAEVCNNERRREAIRASEKINGLDYIRISEKDARVLHVYFLGEVPQDIGPKNILIEGGRRIPGHKIEVKQVEVSDEEDREEDEREEHLKITLSMRGDFSVYTLRIVEISYDKNHQPVYQRLSGFDNRYDALQFSFDVHCANDLDCQPQDSCPPTIYESPEISYLAKDFASFRQLILDRLALTLPGWQERHVPDIGIAMIEILAYVGDHLSYYQDAVATEAYLGTARQRISVRRHVRLVDYAIHEGCNARAWLHINTPQDFSEKTETKISSKDVYFVTGQNNALDVQRTVLTDDDVQRLPASDYEAFQPLFEGGPAQAPRYLSLYAAHNEIHFYTWDDQECCLPRGATSATLQDYQDDAHAQGPRVLHLAQGDFLLFEEVRGSKTGLASDALASHRHVVRLTNITEEYDVLHDSNVLTIEWGQEDALLFPLCLSSIGQAPDCQLVQHVSVARGNLLLVDHGLTISPAEDSWTVQEAISIPICEGENQPSDVAVIAAPFHPVLSKFPLTFSQKLLKGKAASQVLIQDVRQAQPNIKLTSTLPTVGSRQVSTTEWQPRYGLLESEPEDAHVVVELDNDARAHLRFGNDDTGRAPAAHERFVAEYRVGNGPAGNVGAEAITHIVFRQNFLPGIILTPRNPFAAVGGTLPEPIAEVKQFAPHAFRTTLERAITADDYVQLLKGYPGVQRTAATLRWNGSGYDVLIAVDPLGSELLSESLRTNITLYLEQFRRIGHDIAVVQAHYVPIEVKLCVVVQAHYLRGHVKADLLKRLGNGVLPDGSKGFFHPDTLSFGDNIAVSMLVALVQAVPGVQYIEVVQLERFGEGPDQELEKGVLEIGPLEIAQLDNDPNFPEHGKLTLDMKGGR